MPFSGSSPTKTFSRTDGTRTGSQTWQQAKAAPVKIRADAHDTHDQDIADAISSLWLRDGGNQPTADLPLNSFKFTGVGNAAARTQFAAAAQVQDSALLYAGTSTGTDTIAATLSPAITAYVAGQRYHFKAGGTNTGAATINFNSVGAAAIKKGPAGSVALAAGDITTGGTYSVVHDGTNFILENPGLASNVSAFMATVLDDADAATARATLGVGIGTNVQAWDADLDAIAALAKTDGNVIVGNGSAWVAESGATARASLAVGGAAVQRAYAETASFTTSSNIPSDGTVPQITEGAQILSQTITPTNSANRIRISFHGSFVLGGGAGVRGAVALFNGAASAIAVAAQAYSDNDHPVHIGLVHEQVAGTTSPITFSVRAGANAGKQDLMPDYGTTIPRASLVVEEINV